MVEGRPPFSWNVAPPHWMTDARRFEKAWHFEPWNIRPSCPETSVTSHPLARLHTDTLQKNWDHNCAALTAWTLPLFIFIYAYVLGNKTRFPFLKFTCDLWCPSFCLTRLLKCIVYRDYTLVQCWIHGSLYTKKTNMTKQSRLAFTVTNSVNSPSLGNTSPYKVLHISCQKRISVG